MMPQFINPALAWAGLAAVSVPILIHLLTRRPKRPKAWAAMRFVLAVYKKHHRRSRLEQWLLLAARCLLLALLGVALAGPVWSAMGAALGLGPGGRTVIIVLDNGLTSQVQLDDGRTRLDRLKDQAEGLLNGLTSLDQVALITAAGPPEALITPPKLDLDLARRRLLEVTASESATDMTEALRAAQTAIEMANDVSRPAFVVVFSDFSAGSMRLDEPLPEDLKALGERATLLRLEAEAPVDNVQIADLKPDRRLIAGELELPGQHPVVNWSLSLARFGRTPAKTQAVRLEVPGVPLANAQVTWAQGQRTAVLTVPTELTEPGTLVAKASLEGMDRLPVDDRRHSVVQVRQKLSVVILSRKAGASGFKTPQRFLELAIGPEEGQLDWPIALAEADAAAASAETFRDAHVVFVLRPDLMTDQGWSDLKAWVAAGGVVWITPPTQQSAGLWPQKMVDRFGLGWLFEKLEPVQQAPPLSLKTDRPAMVELERLAGEIQRKGILRSVKVFARLPLKETSVTRRADRLLVGAGGEPLWLGTDVEGGRLIFSTFALDARWTNLPLLRSAFPPLVAQLLRGSTDRLQPAEVFEVGQRPSLTGNWRRAGQWVGPDGQTTRLAVEAAAVRPVEPMRRSGVYRSPNQVMALVANVRSEAANTQSPEATALARWLDGCGTWRVFKSEAVMATMAQATQAHRTDWSQRLLVLVALLALFEMFLARWVSHVSVRGRTEDAVAMADLETGERR